MAGGHGGIIIGGPIMMKDTNLIEREFYKWIFPHPPPALPLAPPAVAMIGLAPAGVALPGHAPLAHAALRARVPNYYGVQTMTNMLVLENLADGLNFPRFLDVKIGERTCSKQELIASGRGANSSWIKKEKLKIADWITKSSERGFRVVAASCFPNDNRRTIARRDPQQVYTAFFAAGGGLGGAPPVGLRQQVANQIEQIRTNVNWCDYAMIAASVLVIIGTQAPAGGGLPVWVGRVKLIDFAHSYHYQRLGNWNAAQFRKYSSNFSEGLAAFSISFCPYP